MGLVPPGDINRLERIQHCAARFILGTVAQGTRVVCPLSFKAQGVCVHYRSRRKGCVSTIAQGTRGVCSLSFKAQDVCVHYRSRHEGCVSAIVQSTRGVSAMLTNL